jgi:hypothetical protein
VCTAYYCRNTDTNTTDSTITDRPSDAIHAADPAIRLGQGRVERIEAASKLISECIRVAKLGMAWDDMSLLT